MKRQPPSLIRAIGLLSIPLMMLVVAPRWGLAQVSVTTQHNDNLRDGLNAEETVLTQSNVNESQFGRLFKVSVDDQVFAQPLVVNSIAIQGVNRSVVYVATANNSVYAFDALTGTQYWKVNLGTAFVVADTGFDCTDTLASAGIMSTPVIDATLDSIYVVAKTYVSGTAAYKLHALNLATGTELPGSPVPIQASGLDPAYAVQRTGLLLANGNIYFSFAGHCDQGSYKGITLAYSASTLAQVGMHNASPSDNGAGIWQGGNGAAADSAGNVYWVTGNGTWDGATNFSETIIKASSTLGMLDWHTPTDQSALDSSDLDLTSSGPLLIPGKSLLVTGGKDGYLRLINTENMGHLGDTTAVLNWQANPSHIHSLAFFDSNLYEWGQAGYLQVFSFNGSSFSTTPTYKGTIAAIGHPGASLSISANVVSNGILWAATNTQGPSDGTGAWHMTEPGILYAYSLPSMTELWSNQKNSSRDNCDNYAKFAAPTIANGRVYLASFGTAQTKSGELCAYGLLQPDATLIPDGTYTITSVHSGQALDDPGFSTTDGVGMQQYPVNSGTNQQWTVHNIGNNVITLTNVASSQSLDVAAGSTANSALVVQYPYHNVAWQQWKVISVGTNSFELVSENSGQALDVDGGGVAPKAQIDQFPYQGTPWQQWIFTKL
jgi:outer membrane protein assembly factor BamB